MRHHRQRALPREDRALRGLVEQRAVEPRGHPRGQVLPEREVLGREPPSAPRRQGHHAARLSARHQRQQHHRAGAGAAQQRIERQAFRPGGQRAPVAAGDPDRLARAQHLSRDGPLGGQPSPAGDAQRAPGRPGVVGGAGDPLQAAVRARQVDDADVGQGRDDEARDIAERRPVVERRGDDPARLGQQAEPALRLLEASHLDQRDPIAADQPAGRDHRGRGQLGRDLDAANRQGQLRDGRGAGGDAPLEVSDQAGPLAPGDHGGEAPPHEPPGPRREQGLRRQVRLDDGARPVEGQVGERRASEQVHVTKGQRALPIGRATCDLTTVAETFDRHTTSRRAR